LILSGQESQSHIEESMAHDLFVKCVSWKCFANSSNAQKDEQAVFDAGVTDLINLIRFFMRARKKI